MVHGDNRGGSGVVGAVVPERGSREEVVVVVVAVVVVVVMVVIAEGKALSLRPARVVAHQPRRMDTGICLLEWELGTAAGLDSGLVIILGSCPKRLWTVLELGLTGRRRWKG